MKDYIIIGAGLSGLNAARKIQELGLGSVLVLEKSRGIGGRMATRRTLDTRFDHGAQFYRLKSDISELHKAWKENKITHQWFVSFKGDHWCASNGMTSLAKNLAGNLEIELEKQISSIEFKNNSWKIFSNKNEEWECRHLIISAPLPQALVLLAQVPNEDLLNHFEVDELKKINYTKALVGLITLENDIFINEFGYEEFQTGDFFSIADQKKKGVSESTAITITMSPEFSSAEFDNLEEKVLAKILKTFNTKFPQATIMGSELKKWRYCHPSNTYKNLFFKATPTLYLIGDAFGGSSLLGAIRSSEALVESIAYS